MKFAKGYNQQSVDNFIQATRNNLNKQEHCNCRLSSSTRADWADIYGRPICQHCGKPMTTEPRVITTPYWFYKQN